MSVSPTSFWMLFIIFAALTLSYAERYTFPTIDIDHPSGRIGVDDLEEDSAVQILVDPPGGFVHHGAAVFIRATRTRASDGLEQQGTIHYEVQNQVLGGGIQRGVLTWNAPYVHIVTGFDNIVEKVLYFTVVFDNEATAEVPDPIPARSPVQQYEFEVEAGDRQNAFAYLVPGIESRGHFIRVALEVKAAARAQSSGSQEFANFSSLSDPLGVGTYSTTLTSPQQVYSIPLPEVYYALDGYEGGFNVDETPDGGRYGVLVPHHNGYRFHGLVVRVDLEAMAKPDRCMQKVRFERWNRTSGRAEIVTHATAHSSRTYDEPTETACIVILDLESLHPRAYGFRRGFSADYFGFLAPGAKDVAVRLNLTSRGSFTLENTRVLPLGDYDLAFGGYSGGFADGKVADGTHWACLNPYRSVYGPVGGYMSQDPAEKFLLQPIHTAFVTCIKWDAWDIYDFRLGESGGLKPGRTWQDFNETIQWIDLGNLARELRGFSEAIRVGRYAYLAPLAHDVHAYASKLTRIYLGDGHTEFIGDIIHKKRTTPGAKIRDILDVIDLSDKDENLAGFSGIFQQGRYLVLVPFRNKYEPENGQRGHSFLTRLDMNDFEKSGIRYIELIKQLRQQTPTIPDEDLKGFCCGFASGKYAVLVPFFNGAFSGKMARVKVCSTDPDPEFPANIDLQELDLTFDEYNPGVYKGYRGGFVSTWPAFQIDA